MIDSMFRQIKETEYWNRQGRTLIIVQKITEEFDDTEMAMNAIAATWRWNKAVNVAIMIALAERINFYIWYPYRHPDCRRVTHRAVYEIWTPKGFLYNKNIFPPKIKADFENCPLRFSSSDCLPYTYENYTKGFEATLVTTLARHFNFTLEKIPLPKGESLWTTRYSNGTTCGAFGLLDRQAADLAFACIMLNKERYNLAESLPTYFFDSLTWFVPPPDLESHASNIIEAFPSKYWIAIFLTTVIALCAFLLIVKVEELVLTSEPPQSMIGAVLRVFAITISSPFTLTSRSTLIRLLTFAFAIYSLHITTIYQASLYNLYKSNSYTNVYSSLEDAVNNNLFVWLKESTKNLYDNNDPLWNRILQDGKYAYLDGDLETPFDQVVVNKSAIVLFIKSTMLVYIKEFYTNEYNQPLMRYIPEKFSTYPVTLFLSPGHPLFHVMKKTMYNILASGLVDHWVSRSIRSDLDNEIEDINTDVSLQMEHISGAFVFHIALMALAAGIFLIENLYWFTHGRKVKKPLLREEIHLRRQMILKTAIELGQGKVASHLSRFRAS